MPPALLTTHIVLLIVASATVLELASPWRIKAALLCAVIAPLAAASHGISTRRRYTYQWLSVVLVIYIGAASVEVIAAGSLTATLTLLAALVELSLLISSIRRAAL